MSRTNTAHQTRWMGLAAALIALMLPWSVQGGDFGTPSNLGGIWRLTFTPGVHLISFPFLPQDASLDEVLGNGFPGATHWDEATRIVTIVNGEYIGAYYNVALERWFGNLTTLESQRGYWLILPEDSTPVSVTVAGVSAAQDAVRIEPLAEGLNLVASPLPYPITLEASGLEASGLLRGDYLPLADRVYAWQQQRLAPAWVKTDGAWAGASFPLQPTRGYLIWRTPNRGALEWRLPEPAGMGGWNGQMPGDPEPLPNALRAFTPSIPEFSTPPWGDEPPPRHRTPETRGGAQ